MRVGWHLMKRLATTIYQIIKEKKRTQTPNECKQMHDLKNILTQSLGNIRKSLNFPRILIRCTHLSFINMYIYA
jgi:hypothetical protein